MFAILFRHHLWILDHSFPRWRPNIASLSQICQHCNAVHRRRTNRADTSMSKCCNNHVVNGEQNPDKAPGTKVKTKLLVLMRLKFYFRTGIWDCLKAEIFIPRTIWEVQKTNGPCGPQWKMLGLTYGRKNNHLPSIRKCITLKVS